MAARILAIVLLVCWAAAFVGCGDRHDSQPAGPEKAQKQLKLSIAAIPLAAPEDVFAFRVTLENVDRKDLIVNLGTMRTNGKCQHPDALTLILTDPRGGSRELHFTKSPGHTHPTGNVDPYEVPIPAGSGYFLNLNLKEFAPPDVNQGRLALVPGRYRLRAELTGRNETRSNLNLWAGTVRSEEIAFRIR